MTSEKKIRLGLFIYTPMIGGAEQYFKDLLYSIDRNEFEVTAFYEPWSEFIEFLDFAHAPQTKQCSVHVREVGGHYGAKELTDTSLPKQLGFFEKKLLRIITAQKKLRSPLLKIPGRIARAFMQCIIMVSNALHLFKALRKNPVDVLHVINGGYPGASSAQLAGLVARLTGCRVAMMSVCNTPAAYHFPKTLEKIVDQAVKHFFAALIIPGDYIGKLLVDLRTFHPGHLVKIPEGVALPGKYGAHLTPETSHPPTLVMVAGFLHHKGHHILLESLSLLSKDFPTLRVGLVGDGPTLAQTRAKATELKLTDRVTFYGFRPLNETLEIISAADLLVHPALMDGMPYVILHAMSLGKAIVTTPVGDIAQVVLDGTTGVLVPPGDAPALVQALRELLQNPEKIRTLGTAGKQRYVENYTIERMVKNHEQLYQSLHQPK